MKKVIASLATILAAVALGACGEAGGSTQADKDPGPTRFQSAVKDCPAKHVADVGDGGRSLMLSTRPYRESVDVVRVACVLQSLDVSDAVLDRMSSTNSLMGEQRARWDGIRAHWSYHPDNGMQIVLTERS